MPRAGQCRWDMLHVKEQLAISGWREFRVWGEVRVYCPDCWGPDVSVVLVDARKTALSDGPPQVNHGGCSHRK
jgi:hypothetical protein